MPKRPIRKKLLTERQRCPAETCLRLSLLIQARFLDSAAYHQAGCVGLYSAFQNEVHTEQVARRCLADGKRLSYPRVHGTMLQFVAVAGIEELSPGAYGISEPTGEKLVYYQEIDLLIVPGIAFDLNGHRLGYGKGYYDRLLSNCRPDLERVGFAYEFQVVASLPAEAHDCRISQLVTEQRLLRFPVGGGGQ